MGAQQQVSVAGKAVYAGIPDTSVSWGDPGNQDATVANKNTLTIWTQIQKTPHADKAMTRDNANEVINKRRSNKTMTLRFSAKSMGNNAAAAQALMANCPLEDDVVNITCALDPQAAGVAYVESAEVSETPDGEMSIDFTVVKYANAFLPVVG